jgi:hypothetical protein
MGVMATKRSNGTIMKKERIKEIIAEEIENVKWGKRPLKENIDPEQEKAIRDIIRTEVSAIFFELFKKRKTWGA